MLVDETAVRWRILAGKRMLKLMEDTPSRRRPGSEVTQEEFAELIGTTQTKVSRASTLAQTDLPAEEIAKRLTEEFNSGVRARVSSARASLTAMGLNEALAMSAVDSRNRGAPGRPALYWLAADFFINNWPDANERLWLRQANEIPVTE